jgi:hypothetical protein
MTDQSAQHGQRVDDEMSSDVEALVRGAPVGTRAREDLDAEAPETKVPLPDPRDEERHEAVLQRSELARFLRPSALPAHAAALLEVAHEEAATEIVLRELQRLPRDVEFPTIAAIWEALGHETEHRDQLQPPGPDRAAHEEGSAPGRAPEPGSTSDRSAHIHEDHVTTDGARPDQTDATNEPVGTGDTDEAAHDDLGSGSSLGGLATGVGLVRSVLGLADRALGALQDRLSR